MTKKELERELDYMRSMRKVAILIATGFGIGLVAIIIQILLLW